MRVKVFYAVNNYIGSAGVSLEQAMNEFFANFDGTIHEIHQSSSGRMDHHTTITIFYLGR